MKIQGYHIHFYCTTEQIPLADGIRSQLLHDLPVIDGAGPVRHMLGLRKLSPLIQEANQKK
ncbi:MAG: hypothetical protein ACOYOK_11810 [Pseudobdellovibrionaceae bacterium]